MTLSEYEPNSYKRIKLASSSDDSSLISSSAWSMYSNPLNDSQNNEEDLIKDKKVSYIENQDFMFDKFQQIRQ